MQKRHCIILLLVLIFSCSKRSTEKEILVEAKLEMNIPIAEKMRFKFYADSSYIFSVERMEFNHKIAEEFSGRCFLKNDTIIFNPFPFKYIETEKAVIKNGFIDFLIENSVWRLEITKNETHIKNKLNFDKLNDYAIFPYTSSIKSEYVSHELNQHELELTKKLVISSFEENKSHVKKESDYFKQCVAVKNAQNEIEVWVNCFCKTSFRKDDFKFRLINMDDGGKCNILVKLNVTKDKIIQFNIAGRG